jgi:hypothetical protein
MLLVSLIKSQDVILIKHSNQSYELMHFVHITSQVKQKLDYKNIA